ncbi:MAG: H-NS histone family protein [Burkholderiaceae bacterium]|nr:H-NS histone family protein [Burkholderiaceae bacterium]
MATSLKELFKQREELEAQIKQVQAAAKASAVAKIHQLIADNELVQEDIFGGHRKRKAGPPSAKVAVKYRDTTSGAEWSGRGRTPVWLADKNRDDYLIK